MPERDKTENLIYYRAITTLARSLEGQLAVIGPVSDSWLREETERKIAVKELKTGGKADFLAPRLAHRHIDQLVSEGDASHYGLQTSAHEPIPQDNGFLVHVLDLPDKVRRQITLKGEGGLRIETKESDRLINSNIVPMLSPALRQHLVAGNLLTGANLDEQGNLLPEEQRPFSVNLIAAAMISDVYGEQDAYSSLDDSKTQTIDDDYIRTNFNEDVLQHVHAIRLAQERFERSLQKGIDPATLDIPAEYQSVLAAKYAIRMQEAAKAASYGLLSAVSPLQRQELTDKGFPPRPSRETEKEILRAELARAQAAANLPGVSRAIAWPLKATLLPAADDALGFDHPESWHELVGIGGRAFEALRLAMPINRFAAEKKGPDGQPVFENNLYAVSRGVHEIANYHAHTRRKGRTSILQHVCLTLDNGSKALGGELRPVVAVPLLMHDLPEDGGLEVAGLNHSVSKVSRHFGQIVAQVVADLTDNDRIGHKAGFLKAEFTAASAPSSLTHARTFEDRSDIPRSLGETETSRAYSLTSAGPKIADLDASMTELIREPQASIGGYLSGSGMRIGWIVGNKGFVETNLVGRYVAGFVKDYDSKLSLPENQNAESQRAIRDEILPSGHRQEDLAEGLRVFVANHLDTADQFAVQNLTILAYEFGLDEMQRMELVDDFYGMDTEAFQEKYLLGEKALFGPARFQAGNPAAPSANYSAIYTPRGEHRYAAMTAPLTEAQVAANPGAYTLISYKMIAQGNLQLRQDLGLASPNFTEGPLADVVARYRRKMDIPEPDEARRKPALVAAGPGVTPRLSVA